MRRQAGFFDIDERLMRLSDLGDQLEGFRAAVDFEMFRDALDQALAYADGAQGGRPPFDPVMMFKILVIQATPLQPLEPGNDRHIHFSIRGDSLGIESLQP